MKLAGSQTANYVCGECGICSAGFRVYFYIEDGQGFWQGNEPIGWDIDDEAPIWADGEICGTCPKCTAGGASLRGEGKSCGSDTDSQKRQSLMQTSPTGR